MRILRVDLTGGKFSDEEVSKDDQLKYMGGRGLAAKMLYFENKPRVDPYDPENRLIIMTGPYTGTFGSFSAFYNVTTKSPLTGAILSAHSGGHWGPMLRRTGYDGIVFKGRAKEPTYLFIGDNGPELRDASDALGQERVRDHRRPGGPAREVQGVGDRPRGREQGQVRGDHERHEQGCGKGRGRRGHGVQEPQGRGRARHEGCIPGGPREAQGDVQDRHCDRQGEVPGVHEVRHLDGSRDNREGRDDPHEELPDRLLPRVREDRRGRAGEQPQDEGHRVLQMPPPLRQPDQGHHGLHRGDRGARVRDAGDVRVEPGELEPRVHHQGERTLQHVRHGHDLVRGHHSVRDRALRDRHHIGEGHRTASGSPGETTGRSSGSWR